MSKATTLTAYLGEKYVTVHLEKHSNIVETLGLLNTHYRLRGEVEPLLEKGFIVKLAETVGGTSYFTDYGEEYTATTFPFEFYHEVFQTFPENQYGFLWIEGEGWSVVFN